jgi:hypothetical protein
MKQKNFLDQIEETVIPQTEELIREYKPQKIKKYIRTTGPLLQSMVEVLNQSEAPCINHFVGKLGRIFYKIEQNPKRLVKTENLTWISSALSALKMTIKGNVRVREILSQTYFENIKNSN